MGLHQTSNNVNVRYLQAESDESPAYEIARNLGYDVDGILDPRLKDVSTYERITGRRTIDPEGVSPTFLKMSVGRAFDRYEAGTDFDEFYGKVASNTQKASEVTGNDIQIVDQDDLECIYISVEQLTAAMIDRWPHVASRKKSAERTAISREVHAGISDALSAIRAEFCAEYSLQTDSETFGPVLDTGVRTASGQPMVPPTPANWLNLQTVSIGHTGVGTKQINMMLSEALLSEERALLVERITRIFSFNRQCFRSLDNTAWTPDMTLVRADKPIDNIVRPMLVPHAELPIPLQAVKVNPKY